MNKRIILILISILLITTLLTGCQKKLPDGFSQEFYNDIVSTINSIIEEIPYIKKEDVINSTIIKFQSYSDFCDKYYDVKENGELTITEEKAFNSLTGAVLGINTDFSLFYKYGDDFPSKYTTEKVEELANILEIDIEYK